MENNVQQILEEKVRQCILRNIEPEFIAGGSTFIDAFIQGSHGFPKAEKLGPTHVVNVLGFRLELASLNEGGRRSSWEVVGYKLHEGEPVPEQVDAPDFSVNR